METEEGGLFSYVAFIRLCSGCGAGQTTPNHKVKQAYWKEESDRVRIEKNHEPVVSDRDFEVSGQDCNRIGRNRAGFLDSTPDKKCIYTIDRLQKIVYNLKYILYNLILRNLQGGETWEFIVIW